MEDVLIPRLVSSRTIFLNFGNFQKYLVHVNLNGEHLQFFLRVIKTLNLWEVPAGKTKTSSTESFL